MYSIFIKSKFPSLNAIIANLLSTLDITELGQYINLDITKFIYFWLLSIKKYDFQNFLH